MSRLPRGAADRRAEALAHITGGGLTENVPRMLPEGLGAEIDLDVWACRRSSLAAPGRIAYAEMLRAFNCGDRNDAGRRAPRNGRSDRGA